MQFGRKVPTFWRNLLPPSSLQTQRFVSLSEMFIHAKDVAVVTLRRGQIYIKTHIKLGVSGKSHKTYTPTVQTFF
jgi:hypothetical protein